MLLQRGRMLRCGRSRRKILVVLPGAHSLRRRLTRVQRILPSCVFGIASDHHTSEKLRRRECSISNNIANRQRSCPCARRNSVRRGRRGSTSTFRWGFVHVCRDDRLCYKGKRRLRAVLRRCRSGAMMEGTYFPSRGLHDGIKNSAAEVVDRREAAHC